jgi:signal transduction histidine kinase
MQPFESLSRRITVAFVLFSLVLSVFFAVLAAVAVEGIEVHLVDNRLADVERWARPRHAAGLEADLPAGLRFHRGDDIPLSLRNLPEGVSDVDVDGVALHVLSGADGRGPYVVVDHESDYEKVELVVYSMFAAFFLGFLILAAFLGSYVGRRIVVPAIKAHTAAIRAVLDRERFFTGDVSHELRTPLSVILGASEILLDQQDAPGVREPVLRIHRSAQEATESINVLLLLARAPTPGRQEAIALSEIVQCETARYQSLVSAKPVSLQCRIDGDVSVQAPRELITCAVANLVRNACQYTERGEVKLVLDAGQLIVEDTGPGLPAAVREELTGAGAPAATPAGSGLGLALVRRICDYIGAKLEYQERSGGGSRFILHFAPI